MGLTLKDLDDYSKTKKTYYPIVEDDIIESTYKFMCEWYKTDIALAKMNGTFEIFPFVLRINNITILIGSSFKKKYQRTLEFFAGTKKVGDMTAERRINTREFEELYNRAKKCLEYTK